MEMLKKNSLRRDNGIITRAEKDKCKRKPSKMQERERERAWAVCAAVAEEAKQNSERNPRPVRE